MKKLVLKTGILFMLTLLVILILNSCSKSNEAGIQPIPDPTEGQIDKSGPNETLALFSDEEALLFMREEEKMARDVYIYLLEKWELKVFENISNSEQVHMDRVLDLLNLYGLEDPALPGYGEFVNQDLQELYDKLISSGEVSLINALIAGATIEEVDIVDLQTFIESTEDEYLKCVFGNLMRASRNHLRAFYRHLEFRDVEYTPQYLSIDEFKLIVGGPHEAGGTPCNP